MAKPPKLLGVEEENMSKLFRVMLSAVAITFALASFGGLAQGQGGGGKKAKEAKGAAQLLDANGDTIGVFVGGAQAISVFPARDENNQPIGDVVLTKTGGAGTATTEVAEVQDQQPGAVLSSHVLIPGSDSEQYIVVVSDCTADDDRLCRAGEISVSAGGIFFESLDCTGPPFLAGQGKAWGAPRAAMADNIGYAAVGENIGPKTVRSFESQREDGVCFNAANPPPNGGFQEVTFPTAFAIVAVFDLSSNPRPWRAGF